MQERRDLRSRQGRGLLFALDPLDLPEGGFGWCLIQGLTQSLCYYREGQRNCLAFMVPYHQSQFSGPISG